MPYQNETVKTITCAVLARRHIYSPKKYLLKRAILFTQQYLHSEGQLDTELLLMGRKLTLERKTALLL